MDAQWFKKRMRELRVTQEDIARQLGRDRSIVSRILTGTQPMGLKEARVFSQMLDVPLGEVLRRAGQPVTDRFDVEQFVPVEVVGTVQAGIWREAVERPAPDVMPIYVERPPGDGRLFAVDVRGDSMDLVFRQGETLVCQPIDSFPGELRSGLFVIVERRRHDIVETTVKELEITDTGWILWPKSSNPAHGRIDVAMHGDGADETSEIRVTGVVLSSHRRLLPGFQ